MITKFNRFAGFRLAQIQFRFVSNCFCTDKPPDFNNSELQKQQDEKKKLNTKQLYKEFLKSAIIEAQKNKQDKVKGPEEYRAAILFDEILNRETLITLYDTKGRLYWSLTIWYLFGIVAGTKVIYDVLQDEKWYKKDSYIFQMVVGVLFAISRIFLYRRMFKYHVEKIVYDTNSKEMILSKRNIFGVKKNQQLKPDKILYTQDKTLNAKKINYINIDNLECYTIGYQFAWKNKELFSHLLQQNVSNLKSYYKE